MALFSSSDMTWPSLPMPFTILTWFSSMLMIGFRSSPELFLVHGSTPHNDLDRHTTLVLELHGRGGRG